MNKGLLGTLAFISGAAVGAIVAWKLAKDKYEKIAEEEIASVKEVYSRKVVEMEEKEVDEDQSTLEEYMQIAKDEGYSSDEEVDDIKKPYVISPEQFENSEYPVETLTYYNDGVLTDDQNNVIEDAASMVGVDFPEHYGEFEDDCVYVRNDKEEVDYEILADLRNYADVVGSPHQNGE